MDEIEKTKRAALRLLAFRPRSENELRSRLTRKKLPGEAINRVMEGLRADGMLDDARFAKLYALSRIQSRTFGKERVKRELMQRGLSGEAVENAMESIADIDDCSAAEETARKKLAFMKNLLPEAKKRRLHGMLMRRGFNATVIFKVLDKLLGAGSDEGF